MKRSLIAIPLAIVGFLVVVVLLIRTWLLASYPPSTTECMRHIHQLGQSLQLYLSEHGHVYPVSLKQAADFYFDNPPSCPESADEDTTVGGAEFGYLYFAGGRKESDVGPDEVVAIDSRPRHWEGGQVLFGDGHIVFAEGEEFRSYLTRRATTQLSPTSSPIK